MGFGPVVDYLLLTRSVKAVIRVQGLGFRLQDPKSQTLKP